MNATFRFTPIFPVIICLLLLAVASVTSCTEDEGPVNASPEVTGTLNALSLEAGFGTYQVSFNMIFSDPDKDQLTHSVTSSDETVVTASLAQAASIILTEKGTGTATIIVTADDGKGGSVSAGFSVTVTAVNHNSCPNDNSVNTERWSCDEQPSVASDYSESVSGGKRTITTNGIPDHEYRNQIPKLVSELNASTKTYTVDATPALAAKKSQLVNEGHPLRKFGVAINGVAIDPAPAEPFIFENPNTGEYNWDWVMEPNNNKQAVGLDCATAHVQPDGTYHYHGDPATFADQLLAGLGSGTTTPDEPVHIGWAADGFPILYKYGYNQEGEFKKLQPSYQLKSGNRPGDGITEPCGTYNGKYTNDYEYVAGSGDLDECNGIAQQITIGQETFGYFYVITDDFPVVPRCLSGTPDKSFSLGPP